MGPAAVQRVGQPIMGHRLHMLIAQLGNPNTLHQCGFVLMPNEAADVDVAQAR